MKDLSLHLLDLAENSIRAGAKHIVIEVASLPQEDKLSLSIADDGCGMDEEMVKAVQDPFFTTRTTRKVGLGIPLFKEGLAQSNGFFSLLSAPGKGTRISGTYQASHLDRPPLGDTAGSVVTLVVANPELDFYCCWSQGEKKFVFDTQEIRRELDGVPLDTPEVQAWIKDFIYEGVNVLYGGMTL